MKHTLILLLTALALCISGCKDSETRLHDREMKKLEKESSITFMPFNYRKEIVSTTYSVPELKTERAGNYLKSKTASIPGHVATEYKLSDSTVTISYKSSVVRSMNFEECIAIAGFKCNSRPANPKAKLPEGIK